MDILRSIFSPEKIIMSLPVGLTVFYYENGYHVLDVSEEAGRILSYSVSEYIKVFENSIDLIFEDRLQEFEAEIDKLTQGGIPLNFTIYSPDKYGEYRWINLCVSVEEREGYRVYFLISKDISGLKEQLDERASQDALTGLLNRGAFEELFNNKAKTFNDLDESAFILVDIDNFKKINDTYGHQEGDKFICMVADVLRKSFGEEDLVARLGGDEFAIVFWNAQNKENTKKRIKMIFDYLSGSISVSIGVASFLGDKSTFSELYRNADNELYKVKRGNKGNYSISD